MPSQLIQAKSQLISNKTQVNSKMTNLINSQPALIDGLRGQIETKLGTDFLAKWIRRAFPSLHHLLKYYHQSFRHRAQN
jgi:hypothetical protein